MNKKPWILLGADSKAYASEFPGTLGGRRKRRVYGRLDCRAALQAIARGGYVKHRVFFVNETIARAAGYRPCAVCIPAAYAQWKAVQYAKAKSESAHLSAIVDPDGDACETN